jgi:hypothetical protein
VSLDKIRPKTITNGFYDIFWVLKMVLIDFLLFKILNFYVEICRFPQESLNMEGLNFAEIFVIICSLRIVPEIAVFKIDAGI